MVEHLIVVVSLSYFQFQTVLHNLCNKGCIVHGLGWVLCDFYVPYVSLHIIEVDHVGHQKREVGHLVAWSDLRK